MSRFNPFTTPLARRLRIAVFAVMLAGVPLAAQEVVVTISMNTCWNTCSRMAGEIYNHYFYDVWASHEFALDAAEDALDDCLEWSESWSCDS